MNSSCIIFEQTGEFSNWKEFICGMPGSCDGQFSDLAYFLKLFLKIVILSGEKKRCFHTGHR